MTTKSKATITLLIDNPEDEPQALKTINIWRQNQQISFAQIVITRNWQLLTTRQTELIAYLPAGAIPNPFLPPLQGGNFLAPLPPDVALPQATALEISVKAIAWVASANLIQSLPPLQRLKNKSILEIARILDQAGIFYEWRGVQASPRQDNSPSLTENASILAIVPHYRCETWLHRCLRSLVAQTRPLQGIVVVDDGSGNPPVDIVKQFPSVTLLASAINVGPYRIIQQVIQETNYDAYLFQDADDWSTSDRLLKLLHCAMDKGAELIGTQEIRVFETNLMPVTYPLDVNAALAEKPNHPLLHPSSLVARNLVQRLGGFATGLRFGGDTEFLLRAAWIAKIVNIPDYAYFRRKRANSLTTAPDTGLNSPARTELLKTLKDRAFTNYAAHQKGEPKHLSPLIQANPIQLYPIIGPNLP